MIKINSKSLDIILDKEFPVYKGTSKNVEQLLTGDLDLEICKLEGANIVITQADGEDTHTILLGNDFRKTLRILKRVSSLSDEDHMKLYEKYGKFHDGGDDLDYGGLFVGMLYDLLERFLIRGGFLKDGELV
jgi:hypothetical protein